MGIVPVHLGQPARSMGKALGGRGKRRRNIAQKHGGAKDGGGVNLSVTRRLLPASEGPGPLTKKQKQGAAGEILWPKALETGGFPCIWANRASVQPSHHPTTRSNRPGSSTTRPANRPPDRPPRPHLWAPLGTRPGPRIGGVGPWAPPCFFVFCFLFFPPAYRF